ncbi:alpha-mannosidase, putative [Talaromyces stipitatus ATCC 10500]|uniref:alpha-mannosidase n=1 Tax=Talaromyces stipitatus (strain ATCC 10500 / CBS 375.48 / QM 6759 / NRRL 1006) TaxID=441959 RepID=B8MLN8_TALSN|nr:alpha-mannosidase, putative [Talaromyces stipitatus ATCC 10500]EED13901.1 alpha-mannosidase, putative [Talaromyces stipitatus ATCC 10500]
MACNGMFGNGPGRPIFKNNAGGDSIQPPDPKKYFQLSKAEIVVVNWEARMLYMDIVAIHDSALELPDDSWQQHKALNIAMKIINTFRPGNKDSITKCRTIAADFLGPDVGSYEIYHNATEVDIFAIGHCHIDTCWLWPWAETKRKVVRSWLNQCDLMDRYPELKFACSQAQQFKWLKEEYPIAWKRVKEKVKEGQFHPIGGCWVEHYTNMPSGESLVRQFLYGQRFFESNFGYRSKTLWLPDTFGFAAQLPQLSRQAGMNRFLTQKICFNNINEFHHTTFNWIALDGSQVISHMPPVRTYTAEGTVADVKRSIAKHLSLDQDHTALMAFGKGDGGGGPTWQHMERLRRCRRIADEVGILPRVHVGKSVDDFFDGLEKKAGSLVTWFGELYFELHRGTYTTQANTKRNNRRAEFLLRDIELLATVASISDRSYKYPKREIDGMWEAVLLCQFHDCLPGTSIRMCYDDSDKVYENVFATGTALLNAVYRSLDIVEVAEKGDLKKQNMIALNTLPWPRMEIVELSDTETAVASGEGIILALEQFTGAEVEARVTIKETSKGVYKMQNSQLSVTVQNGCIISLYDRIADREIIPEGSKANHVVTEIKIDEISSIKSIISLTAALEGQQSVVECSAEVDWHETMRFLKVEFPVNIRNTEASYEAQYGVIKRPTHYNTSWDMAKFEVCCHKFADLSEHGYGVSILNDSKYGFSTVGNVMRLSLLRSPKAPDDTADMGRHQIRWAIMPHRGGLSAETVRAAYAFNSPLKFLSCSRLKDCTLTQSPIRLTGDQSLILDTIKRGEIDEDVSRGDLPSHKGRSVIIRIYESLGGRARGRVETSWPVSKVCKTNLLEDDEEAVVCENGNFKVDLGAFQVATYRICLA